MMDTVKAIVAVVAIVVAVAIVGLVVYAGARSVNQAMPVAEKYVILQFGNGELIEGWTNVTWSKDGIVTFTLDGIEYTTGYSNVIVASDCP